MAGGLWWRKREKALLTTDGRKERKCVHADADAGARLESAGRQVVQRKCSTDKNAMGCSVQDTLLWIEQFSDHNMGFEVRRRRERAGAWVCSAW